MDILATLQTLYPTFTKTEKKIADSLMANSEYSYFPNSTLEEFSSHLGVGQASVVRLMKKCGYTSYRTFIVELSNAQYQTMVASRMASRQMGDSLLDDLAVQMRRCRDNLSQEDMRQVAGKMRRADLIICTGFGDSAHVAALAASRLRRENLFALQDISGEVSPLSPGYGKSLKALVFAFSVTGETPEIIQAVKRYASNNACVVVFTGHVSSTLAKQADFIFYTPSKVPQGGLRRDMDGIFTQLYSMESIIEEYLTLLNTRGRPGGKE